MNEKDRVLELVKNGIISTEEGIALLEKMANPESAQSAVEPKTLPADVNEVPEILNEAVGESSSSIVENEQEGEQKNDLAGLFSSNDEDFKEDFAHDEFNNESAQESTGKQFDKVFQQAKDAMKEAQEQMRPHVKTIGATLADAYRTVKSSVKENVDWKEVTINVPKVASTQYVSNFEYPENHATIIDVQNTNGQIELKKSEDNVLRIQAKGKIYGSFEAETAEEEFLSKATWNVDDEKIEIAVNQKRILANLTLELPEKLYDHVSLRTMNGNVKLSEIELGDAYVNSTNGDTILLPTKASMLEVKGVNGNVEVGTGDIVDTIINTVNGNVKVTADVQSISTNLVNGDMRLTLSNENLTKVDLSNMNGSIKVAFPAGIGLDGRAVTTFGKVFRKLENVEDDNENQKNVHLLRLGEKQVDFAVKTTTGNIFIKDAE